MHAAGATRHAACLVCQLHGVGWEGRGGEWGEGGREEGSIFLLKLACNACIVLGARSGGMLTNCTLIVLVMLDPKS